MASINRRAVLDFMAQADIRSQRQLAQRMGMDYNYVNRLMTGQLQNPTLSTLHKFAKALKVPTGAFISTHD